MKTEILSFPFVNVYIIVFAVFYREWRVSILKLNRKRQEFIFNIVSLTRKIYTK